MKQGQNIVPQKLGISLVQTYQRIGIDLYKPYLRSKMEKDMKEIAQGTRNKADVLADCVQSMLSIFQQTMNKK